ncbi:hypothetical protein RYX36_014432 [Vicia faba]
MNSLSLSEICFNHLKPLNLASHQHHQFHISVLKITHASHCSVAYQHHSSHLLQYSLQLQSFIIFNPLTTSRFCEFQRTQQHRTRSVTLRRITRRENKSEAKELLIFLDCIVGLLSNFMVV